MAIRNDFTINWSVSPRVITIAAPSVECTMQDLLDTLRWIESQPEAMENAILVAASGKEPLGGGTKVGLTVSLLNTIIGFEARPGPTWTVCNLLGGNLVAFDIDGITTIEPINPTAYVSISKTSSASATLQEQDALQYSSYDGGVSVDTSLGEDCAGIEFPLGTVEHPVNNIIDARTIAENKGFDKFWLIGNLFLTGTDDVSDFTIINRSDNPTKSIVVIDASANTQGTQIRRCAVSGTLDNGVILEESITVGVDYINGYLTECVLASYEIALGGNEPAFFINCTSGIPNALRDEPSINLGGSGQALIMSGYDGEITITNKTGTDLCSIRMNGKLTIDATCTGSGVEVYGDAWIDNQSSMTIIDRTTGTVEEIADSVWNKVLP